MGKLSELFVKLKNKFKSISMGRKIAFGSVILAAIILLIVYMSYSNANKYGILFSNLSADDGKTISDKLDTLKVDKKVQGSTIYVPKSQVDELRLELASSLSDGSKGYELLDNANSFGMTDEEFALEKVRMTEGELEKTIKSFSQIQNARVHITPATDSVFAKDAQPAKASIYVQLKTGEKLSKENVDSIIALVSGGVENLPKTNIEVVDDKMNLLSKDLQDDSQDMNTSIQNQQGLEQNFEKKLEEDALEMLEPILGTDKVKVEVNADLDFDSKENTTISYDPNKVESSSHIIKENSTTGGTNGTATSQSPVDNNMSNTTTSTNGASVDNKDDQTITYNVGQSQTKTVTAPGEVKRLTASVAVNGKLDAATQANIENIVSNVIGLDKNRGDQISVVGMTFDPTASKEAQAEIDAMKAQSVSEQRIALIKTIAMIVGIAAVLGVLLIIFLKSRKNKDKLVDSEGNAIDVVIGDELNPKETINYAPLDLESRSEQSHIENEIKRYASDKPDQVADIIKSWLSEDER